MEEPSNLQDWEILSDSDTNSIAFEEIIHADYFALDSNKLRHAQDKNLMDSQSETEKGASFIADDAKSQMGFDGIDAVDAVINKGGSFVADDSKMELGLEGNEPSYVFDSKNEDSVEEIQKEDSFPVDDSQMEVGFGGSEPRIQNSEHDLGAEEIQKGESFTVDDSQMEVESVEEMDSIDLKELRRDGEDSSQESTLEMSSSENNLVGDGEKKVFMWWKLPLGILNLCVSRVRPVWCISMAAAVIGILMVGRRLYRMKHKSRRIPLKVSFEDKVIDFSIFLLVIFCNCACYSYLDLILSCSRNCVSFVRLPEF